jgi:hypothetical protein
MSVALAAVPAPTIDTTAPLWLVNLDAAPTSAADFAEVAGEAIAELLDEAIGRDGMSSSRAWLVQQLMRAKEAAEDHAQGDR